MVHGLVSFFFSPSFVAFFSKPPDSASLEKPSLDASRSVRVGRALLWFSRVDLYVLRNVTKTFYATLVHWFFVHNDRDVSSCATT